MDSKPATQVRDIVFGASYLVMGLGDVYLGAPVATPLDPRHRLVTTKYNPARTWTPENAVGIGGAYLCVYGMEGPGGYQFVGRTVQMWNRYQQTADFRDGKQWLLRFFDQIRFYPVSSEELLKLRAGFPYGRHPLRIEESHLDLGDYLKFLESQRESIDAFRQRQRSAFDAERERWRAAGLAETPMVENAVRAEAPALPEDCVAITSPVSGSVWQIKVAAGQAVEKGDTLVIMEAMKMEIAVLADTAGTVHSIHGDRGCSRACGRHAAGLQAGAVMSLDLTIGTLANAYRSGALTPTALVEKLLVERRKHAAHNIWISVVTDEALRARARELADIDPAVAAVVRHSVRHQGQHRLRRPADHRRLRRVRLSTHRIQSRGAGADRRRRHRTRQDQSRSIRHRPRGHALALRDLQQRVRSCLHQRRFLERVRGGRGARARQLLTGHRHRGLGPRTRGVQQSGRLQAHAR